MAPEDSGTRKHHLHYLPPLEPGQPSAVQSVAGSPKGRAVPSSSGPGTWREGCSVLNLLCSPHLPLSLSL